MLDVGKDPRLLCEEGRRDVMRCENGVGRVEFVRMVALSGTDVTWRKSLNQNKK